MGSPEGDALSVESLLEESADELYEDAPCGYFSTLEGGRIVKANRTFLAWTGYERDALVGQKRIQDILAPGDRIYYETHYAPLLSMQGTVREIAVEIVCADGSRLPALVNSVLKRAGDGSPAVIRTTVFDARERRRYEQELLRARQELEHRARAAEALALVIEGVVLVDADGCIRLLNGPAEEILGVSRETALDVPLTEAVPGWGAIAKRVPLGSPGRWPRPSVLPLARAGRDAWIAVAGVATGDGTVFTVRDVTSERELDELRSEVVDIVSHELRTPLSGVAGAAQTLLAHGGSLTEEMRNELLAVIVEQSRRQERVLDSILLSSNLDAGSIELREAVCDAAEVLRRAVEAGAGDDTSRVVIEESEPIQVRADAGAAEQALANLVDNALKYSPEGAPVRVGVRALDGFVRFTVADEGPGIPPDAQELVFERFYRLDPEQRSGVGGIGLGLYITNELVSRMDGRVGLLPAERGATFYVDLPRAA